MYSDSIYKLCGYTKMIPYYRKINFEFKGNSRAKVVPGLIVQTVAAREKFCRWGTGKKSEGLIFLLRVFLGQIIN